MSSEPGARSSAAVDIVRKVSLANASLGYGDNGLIFEVHDPLPEALWQHPQQFWSPVLSSRIPGLRGVWIKYEGSHISGSFKDRIIRATLAALLEKHPDCSGIVVPSSGNAAVSAAVFAARHQLPMIAIVPEGTPDARMLPILARGAAVLRAGEGPSASYALAYRIASELGYFPLLSTFASPWAEWGCRAIGRELAVQLPQVQHVVAPVSAGPVLVGTINGLREAGHPAVFPVAIQAQGCAPIAAAFRAGSDHVVPWQQPVTTAAGAIADRLEGYPQDGTRVLSLLRQHGGLADAVSDEAMAYARAALLRYDGLDAEFSACAAVAWLMGAPDRVRPGTVAIVTASGFKHTFAGDVPVASPNHAAIEGRLRHLLPPGASFL
ncbi:pyridoxal-phosphate dependent enzyme [Devosia albogilva]|uniref:Pyridoxal-phosphate dependent enzyme n=1 Tax=Devosia albogilva TaxID=429726 RepID=A0ABW5QFJ7_9HYPH